MIQAETLEKIIQETLLALERSKEEIYAVATGAMDESWHLQEELASLTGEIEAVVSKVDVGQQEEKEARRHLALVSSRFDIYSEEDIRLAYDRAREAQVRLALLQEKEKNLQVRRRETERAWKRMQEVARRAENMLSHVGVAVDYLQAGLAQVNTPGVESTALAVIRAQEKERRRIARSIHDGPAQEVTRLVMGIEYCEKLWHLGSSSLAEELESLAQISRAHLDNLRKIVYDLRPVDLERGLGAFLGSYLDDFSDRTGIKIEFYFTGKPAGTFPEAEVVVFRVIQEALNNIWKHAGATAVKVILENNNSRVRVQITDNGCGFDPDAGPAGFGLVSMQEWAEMVSGSVQVKSRPGEGCIVLLEVPASAWESDKGAAQSVVG